MQQHLGTHLPSCLDLLAERCSPAPIPQHENIAQPPARQRVHRPRYTPLQLICRAGVDCGTVLVVAIEGRQLPFTQIDHHPLFTPLSECKRWPGPQTAVGLPASGAARSPGIEPRRSLCGRHRAGRWVLHRADHIEALHLLRSASRVSTSASSDRGHAFLVMVLFARRQLGRRRLRS